VWDDEEGMDVVKVVDFGIAKFSDASLGSSSATRTGSVLGTPHYMSPEQARGLRSVDSRSDLWSVAVIAYRCIVGALPFEGEAVGDLLVKLCTAPIPVPSQFAPGIPPGFDAWLHKALNRDPAQRFQTAAQLGDSLAAVCGLSVRGQYPSAQDGGSGAYSALGGGSFRQAADGNQATFPSAVSAAAASNPMLLGLPTGAPTTQTPSPVRHTGSGAIAAAVLAALVVLGIGGAVAVKYLTREPSAATTSPPILPSAPASVVSPESAPQAPVPPTPVPPTPVPESPSASASALNHEPTPPSASATTPPAAKPPIVARPAGRPPAFVRPVAKPAEKPLQKPGNDIGF